MRTFIILLVLIGINVLGVIFFKGSAISIIASCYCGVAAIYIFFKELKK